MAASVDVLRVGAAVASFPVRLVTHMGWLMRIQGRIGLSCSRNSEALNSWLLLIDESIGTTRTQDCQEMKPYFSWKHIPTALSSCLLPSSVLGQLLFLSIFTAVAGQQCLPLLHTRVPDRSDSAGTQSSRGRWSPGPRVPPLLTPSGSVARGTSTRRRDARPLKDK